MACPVCFGNVEPAVRESMNAGILVLLGVTVVVLGSFLRFFVALARRARHAAEVAEPPSQPGEAVFSRPMVRLKTDPAT